MERPWHYFWFTLATMTCVLLLGAAVSHRWSEASWGSVADWASGIATAFAAWLALHIANTAASRAEKLRQQERADLAASQRENEVRVLRAMLTVFVNGTTAVRLSFDQMKRNGVDEAGIAKAFLGSGTRQLVRTCLRELSIHQLPSSTSVDALMACRGEWDGLMARMAAIARRDWLDRLDAADFDMPKVDLIVDAIADEIVLRGGRVSADQDQLINMQVAAAIARKERAAHAAAA